MDVKEIALKVGAQGLSIEGTAHKFCMLDFCSEEVLIEFAEAIISAYKAVDDNWVSHQQLVASRAYAEQLREALVVLNGVSDIGCERVYEALSLPHDTSALDAYVSEKVNEIIESHAPDWRNVTNAQHVEMRQKFVEQIATLAKQRDLAVNALEAIAGRRIFIDNLAGNVDIAVMTLDAIKESEGK